MFKNLILIIFLLIAFTSNAQEVLNSLESKYYSKNIKDTERYEIAGKYAQALFFNDNVSKAFKILEENIESAKKEKDGKYVAFLYSIQAMNHQINGNTDASQKSLELAKKYVTKTNDPETLGYVSYCEGWLFSRNGNEVKAVDNFLNAIKNYENAKNSNSLNNRKAAVYNELSSIYANWDEYELQEKYSKKALELAIQNNDANAIFNANMAMGYMYEQQFLSDKTNNLKLNLAEKHYLDAIDIYNKNTTVNPSNLSFAANNLANLYLHYFPESHKSKALEFAYLAKETALKTKESNHIASSYGLMAEIAIQQNDYKSAKNHLLNALLELQKSASKDHNIELTIYESLSFIEEEQGDFSEALRFQKSYAALYKNVYDQEKLEISKRLESQFEKELQKQQYEKLQLIADRKEQQIKLMHSLGILQEQELNNLKLQEENQSKKLKLIELESDKRQQELKLSRLETHSKNKDIINFKERLSYKEQINTYYIILLLFCALLIILLFFSYKQRTKSMKQKEELYNLALEQEKQNSKISTLTALLEGQENERGRLARDLHDGLGGLLSGTKLQLTLINNKTDAHLKPDVQKSINQIDGAVDELRRVAHNLMPDLLMKYGLEITLQEFATRMNNEELEIDVQFLSYENKLSQEKELLVYRIIQELVNNSIKHANPSQIIIQLVEDSNTYNVTVEDDGNGFDVEKLELHNTAGIHNIQSRVEFFKGKLNIQSQQNLGTSIEFQFPKK